MIFTTMTQAVIETGGKQYRVSEGDAIEIEKLSGKKDKVTVIRYKSKSRYFKKRGHRQPYNTVTISKIK
jgi:large subunit ribosomal protein L21